ncbi:MAG TPA: cyclic nucleotide-binding domain-containing protein [Patescibacteria group bacterium]|nr:cyclic nucleotide-binding domain-containing protein [Patescibacteria group bacterium]
MISPETLRRYPFYSFMSTDQLRDVAMISDEVSYSTGDVLFTIGEQADVCFMLIQGAIDLHYVVGDEHEPALRKEFVVGTINPGEVLGISAIVQPYKFTATAIAINDSRLLRTDAKALRELCQKDPALNLGLQTMVAKATMERLHATRVQLAAATSRE